jgi:excisionase family DNA binding protein
LTRLPGAPVPALCPRLLDIRGVAAYLGVSAWTVRDLIAAGQLPRVRLEVDKRELRKVLVDRADVDQLITRGKR